MNSGPRAGPGLRRRLEARRRIVTDYRRMAAIAAALHRRGRRIVFTNGVFDLVHIGHLRLLESARSLGDALIVAVNSDESARRIKGPGRPVASELARAELLAGLRSVDWCFVFAEPDPKRLLAIVRPDVLAKGSDYKANEIVGARFVRSYGGTVVRVPILEGFSTTSTIRRIGRTR